MLSTVENRFDDRLQETLHALQECQRTRALQSCLLCEAMMECPIRERYVRSVYESMSKGQSGGFDF